MNWPIDACFESCSSSSNEQQQQHTASSSSTSMQLVISREVHSNNTFEVARQTFNEDS
jgi:hypothetical protein